MFGRYFVKFGDSREIRNMLYWIRLWRAPEIGRAAVACLNWKKEEMEL